MATIFHHNDLDGRAAAAIVYHGIKNTLSKGEKVKFQELNYKKKINYRSLNEKEVAYVVDYSFTEDTIKQLSKIVEKSKNVIWLDHHKSSKDLIKKYPDLFDKFKEKGLSHNIKMTESGAMLAWKKFFKKAKVEIPNWVVYIDDYDRWVHRYDDSENFRFGMDMWDQEPTGKTFEYLIEDPSYADEIIFNGAIAVEYRNQCNKYNLSKVYEAMLDGKKCLVMNTNAGNSSVFCDKINDYDFVVVWSYSDKTYYYSLYSHSKGADCEEIARKFGGGGHVHAAGFTSKEQVLED